MMIRPVLTGTVDNSRINRTYPVPTSQPAKLHCHRSLQHTTCPFGKLAPQTIWLDTPQHSREKAPVANGTPCKVCRVRCRYAGHIPAQAQAWKADCGSAANNPRNSQPHKIPRASTVFILESTMHLAGFRLGWCRTV